MSQRKNIFTATYDRKGVLDALLLSHQALLIQQNYLQIYNSFLCSLRIEQLLLNVHHLFLSLVLKFLHENHRFAQVGLLLFNEFHVDLYIPQPQDTFDEYKHEPIGVVEDEELEDEQIKEVVRYGLIYQKELFNQSYFLIRPAQVIVVKNKSKDLVEENRGNVE